MSDDFDEPGWVYGDRVCSFCGEYECDGSGYNCPDNYYETYNEGEILEWSG